MIKSVGKYDKHDVSGRSFSRDNLWKERKCRQTLFKFLNFRNTITNDIAADFIDCR